MTARLLPDKDLTALLCRRAYGEDIDKLAAAYLLKRDQVIGLLSSNGTIIRHMFQFLTITPKTLRLEIGIWKQCHRCQREIWTQNNRVVQTCDACRDSDVWRPTRFGLAATAWRGAG